MVWVFLRETCILPVAKMFWEKDKNVALIADCLLKCLLLYAVAMLQLRELVCWSVVSPLHQAIM